MNRLTKAWKALRGTLEPGVREVEKEKVTTRTVYLPAPESWRNYYRASIYLGNGRAHLREYFHSCEQAHATHPGASVTVMLGFEVNGQAYIAPSELIPIEVQPKPKRPKGRA